MDRLDKGDNAAPKTIEEIEAEIKSEPEEKTNAQAERKFI
jgi:hypothetical protein